MTQVTQPLYLRMEDVPRLPRGWRPARINDIAQLLKPGKRYDENAVSEDGMIPVVNQSAEDWHGFHNDEPGVIASDDAPVSTFANHTCAMRLMKEPFSCIQNIFPRAGKPGICDTRFFHYSTFGRVRLAGYKGHHPIYRDVWIPLPPLQQQIQIGQILTAYDDLIENNRRRMALLEESARQLYREWFVRLRFPGHEHTRVVDGVPEGWERVPLGSCVTFLSGGTPRKSEPAYWDGDIPWISSGEMTQLRLQDSSLRLTEEGVIQGSRLVPANTILIVVRGMSLAKEFRLAVTSKPVTFNQDLKALQCNPDVSPEYLFASLVAQRDQIRDRATEASHGTKKLDTPVLAGVPILLAPEILQREFRDFMLPINSQWDNCWNQNQKLRAARDLLLPRLMSGEIVV